MKKQLILLELNELNMTFVEHYITKGYLPQFARLIREHGYCQTTSEDEYENLEPWIQWVTAHTGKTLSEHGIFRLGDACGKSLDQIWERLERTHGIKVGAVSPMNAENRLIDPAFFVPDPWTDTPSSTQFLVPQLAAAISQMVNDNAHGRMTVSSIASVIAGLVKFGRVDSYGQYLRSGLRAVKHPWSRALFLDRLLADVFMSLHQDSQPEFSSLFLNAGAHIQHHYMFGSSAYEGKLTNPEWYLSQNCDPVLEVYQLYDTVIGSILEMAGGARLMLATALHQEPHEQLTYYWRLTQHESFLRGLGIPFSKVSPRMSRDFLITCETAADADETERRLRSAYSLSDREPMFSIDNRGNELFVTLTYAHDIGSNFEVHLDGVTLSNFKKEVSFVAIKNGRHSGIGYFCDTNSTPADLPHEFPLAKLPSMIEDHFGSNLEPINR